MAKTVQYRRFKNGQTSSWHIRGKLGTSNKMEERKAFDILLDYPKKHGLDYETHKNYKRFYYPFWGVVAPAQIKP